MTPTLEDGLGPGGALVGVGVGPVGGAPGVIEVKAGFGEPTLVELSDGGLDENPDVVDRSVSPPPPPVDTLLLVLVKTGLDDARDPELKLGEVVGVETGLSGWSPALLATAGSKLSSS